MTDAARSGGRDRSLEAIARVRGMTQELIVFLDQPRPAVSEPGAHPWASELYGRLTALHQELSAQYRAEEEAGLVAGLSETHPRAADRLQGLLDAHHQILSDVRAIVSASMSYAEARTPPNPHLREWTRSLLDNLEAHEAEEASLIQELVYTDVGAGD